MTTLSPESKVEFLLATLKSMDDAGKPDFQSIAVDAGIQNKAAARRRFKAIVEQGGRYELTGSNRVVVQSGAPKAVGETQTEDGTSKTGHRDKTPDREKAVVPVTPRLAESGDHDTQDIAGDKDTPNTPNSTPAKKRGRPKKAAMNGKSSMAEPISAEKAEDAEDDEETNNTPKTPTSTGPKKRGRPKKETADGDAAQTPVKKTRKVKEVKEKTAAAAETGNQTNEAVEEKVVTPEEVPIAETAQDGMGKAFVPGDAQAE